MSVKRKYLIALVLLIGLSVFLRGGQDLVSGSGFNAKVKRIVASSEFGILSWEIKTIAKAAGHKVLRLFSGRVDSRGDAALVEEYFSLDTEDRDFINSSAVGSALKKQIESILRKEDIFASLLFWRGVLPPLFFTLEQPPRILVIAPRDEITIKKTILLASQLSDAAKERIENQIDELGVSSLVEPLRGVAVYPSLVNPDQGLEESIQTIVHEWLHQYLFFRQVGFHYNSGDYDLVVINETIADIVANEITEMVLGEYYSGYRSSAGTENPAEAIDPTFDVNLEMRNIRAETERLLEQGGVEEAESYMRERRDFLAAKGYMIRKINQAWLAFHGAYAAMPGVESPIGEKLRAIRSKSASLRDFLDRVSDIGGLNDLEATYQKLNKPE